MKKKLGAVVGLYPTPVTVVGTVINERINWINVAHVGVIGMDSIMLSINKIHYSNQGIIDNGTVSVNLVTEEMIVAADYVGMKTGKNTDKSEVFEVFYGELDNAPMIKQSPLCMECRVTDIYDSGTHNNFILKVVNTYVSEDKLSDTGKIDFEKVQPVLFEMPNMQYLSTGKKVGKCWSDGKKYEK
ncbi:MAG: flavin reductase family protein [Clostridia bacterium]